MGWLLRDFKTKVFAILGAGILWLYVTTEAMTVFPIKVKVDYTPLPSGIVTESDLSKEITVLFEGKKKRIALFKLFGSPKVDIDLTDIKPGRNVIIVDPKKIKVPSWVDVEPVGVAYPKEIVIIGERIARKAVRVVPQLRGEPAKGFRVSGCPFAVPTTVFLQGGSRLLERYNTVYTDSVDISGAKGNREARVRVHVPRGLTCVPESVVVKVNVSPAGEKVLSSVPVQIHGKGV